MPTVEWLVPRLLLLLLRHLASPFVAFVSRSTNDGDAWAPSDDGDSSFPVFLSRGVVVRTSIDCDDCLRGDNYYYCASCMDRSAARAFAARASPLLECQHMC